ncbi:MAG: hypothetical protein ACE5H1_09910 [Thermodesulfobacteriota bacterium]
MVKSMTANDYIKPMINYFTQPVSPEIKRLGRHIINNPMEWKQETFEFYNEKQDIRIWTCSRIEGIHIDGFDLSLSDKKYLANTIKISKKKKN